MKREQLIHDLMVGRTCNEDCGNCKYKGSEFCRTERSADYILRKYFYKVEEAKIFDTVEKMIQKYGEDSQIEVAIEEMSELIKELIKYMRSKIHEQEKTPDRRKKVVEEMGDVLFMLQYLFLIFKVNDKELKTIIDEKVDRTRQRYLK